MSAIDFTMKVRSTVPTKIRWKRWVVTVSVVAVASAAAGCSSSTAAARQLRTFTVPDEASGALAWSPDGRQILTVGTDGAMLWDATSGKQLLDLRGKFSSEALDVAGAFNADGSKFVTPSNVAGAIVWDTATGRQLATFGPAPVYSARFSPDGTKILTVGPQGAALWDATSAKKLTAFGEGSGGVFGTISNDGTKVVTVSHATTVWDAATGTTVATVGPLQYRINDGALSPDGRRLVVGGQEMTDLNVFDVATGAVALTVPGAFTFAAAFSPDGTELVTALGNQSAAVRKASTGAVLAKLTVAHGLVGAVAFSPDGTLVAADGGTSVTIWDVTKAHP